MNVCRLFGNAPETSTFIFYDHILLTQPWIHEDLSIQSKCGALSNVNMHSSVYYQHTQNEFTGVMLVKFMFWIISIIQILWVVQYIQQHFGLFCLLSTRGRHSKWTQSPDDWAQNPQSHWTSSERGQPTGSLHKARRCVCVCVFSSMYRQQIRALMTTIMPFLCAQDPWWSLLSTAAMEISLPSFAPRETCLCSTQWVNRNGQQSCYHGHIYHQSPFTYGRALHMSASYRKLTEK